MKIHLYNKYANYNFDISPDEEIHLGEHYHSSSSMAEKVASILVNTEPSIEQTLAGQPPPLPVTKTDQNINTKENQKTQFFIPSIPNIKIKMDSNGNLSFSSSKKIKVNGKGVQQGSLEKTIHNVLVLNGTKWNIKTEFYEGKKEHFALFLTSSIISPFVLFATAYWLLPLIFIPTIIVSFFISFMNLLFNLDYNDMKKFVFSNLKTIGILFVGSIPLGTIGLSYVAINIILFTKIKEINSKTIKWLLFLGFGLSFIFDISFQNGTWHFMDLFPVYPIWF